jgi:LAO/AO transport system kinase
MPDRVDKALALDKWSIGQLISVFEDARPGAVAERREILSRLRGEAAVRSARFIGITGTPGAGKSTLIGELALRMIGADASIAVGVLAVDPTSPVSGGALLGDRTRVRFPADEPRLFFRSQATDLDLGGISRHTFSVCRLMQHLFDLVFVETVGIGQSEVEVQHVADWVYLVLQPMAGDQIQFMKAGIMEIPDAFIVNKCDEARAADRTYHALRSSLGLARAGDVPIYRTSATTGAGCDELAADLLALRGRAPTRTMAHKEAHFFEKWVADEHGRNGLAALRTRAPDIAAYIADCGGYDDAQAAFARELTP